MLNGLAPVLIFYFYTNSVKTNSVANAGNISQTTDSTEKRGTPIIIPIYLDEKLTKIAVKNISDGFEIATKSLVKQDNNNVKVLQEGQTQTTNITMVANKDSDILNVFLASFSTIYNKVIAKTDYNIAFFKDTTLIYDSKLKSFSKNDNDNDTLVTINITLEWTKPETTEETPANSELGTEKTINSVNLKEFNGVIQ